MFLCWVEGLQGHKCPMALPPGGALENLAGACHVAVETGAGVVATPLR